MFAFLWGATGYCYVVLRISYHETLKEIWKWELVTYKNLKPMLIRFVIATIAMILFMSWYDPERLFYVWHNNREFIPTLFIAYPLLSALPQEFIFCSFFFTRYYPYFGDKSLMIFMSALVFAYAHMLYINPVAPILSFIGGLIFARTYANTKSLALVTIEHGLYGNALFFVGLGWYFYSGAVGH
jgi:membrane protease YdiL (CAAX protease family)